MIGPGKPSDTQSNFQSRTNFLTTRTILRGVMVGPDGYFRGSFCPVASTLTFVPPMSMTSTLRPLECFIVICEGLASSHDCSSVHVEDSHATNPRPNCRPLYFSGKGTHTILPTIVCWGCERVSDETSNALRRQTLTLRSDRNLSVSACFRHLGGKLKALERVHGLGQLL